MLNVLPMQGGNHDKDGKVDTDWSPVPRSSRAGGQDIGHARIEWESAIDVEIPKISELQDLQDREHSGVCLPNQHQTSQTQMDAQWSWLNCVIVVPALRNRPPSIGASAKEKGWARRPYHRWWAGLPTGEPGHWGTHYYVQKPLKCQSDDPLQNRGEKKLETPNWGCISC